MGFVSLFTDISTEMILAVLPLYLIFKLGVSAVVLGSIEGVSESTASLLKIISGWLSDRVGKRKPLVALGYGFSTIVKPLLAVTTTWPQVLALRFLDRVGKGIRTSPRDALIADSSSSEMRGRTFGFHRTMDTIGAILGPIVAFALLPSLLYRGIFIWSLIPGLLAFIIIISIVHDKPRTPVGGFKLSIGLKHLPSKFRRYLAVVLVFGLGNFSSAFFILNTKILLTPKFGDILASQITILLYALMNVIYALSAFPIGFLADRIGKRGILAVGYLAFGFACTGFVATPTDVFLIGGLFIISGFFLAVVDTMERAYTADLVPADLWGIGYGSLHAVNGFADLPASIVAGLLWSILSPAATFTYGAVMAVLAVLIFLLVS